MQDTHPKGLCFFRSYEPAGFRMLNRSLAAAEVSRLPRVGDRALATRAWFKGPGTAGDFIDLYDSSRAKPATTLRVLFSRQGLFVGARMEEPEPGRMRRLIPSGHKTGELKIKGAPLPYAAWKDDSFDLAVDARHGHGEYINFFVTCAGFARAGVMNFEHSEHVHPSCKKTERAKVKWSRRAVVAKDAWYVFISVPWSSLGLDGPPEPRMVGMNAVRMRSHPEMIYHALARVSAPKAMPAAEFADVYLGGPRISVPVVDFGTPVLDWNEVVVSVEGRGAARLRARVESRLPKAASPLSDEVRELRVASGRVARVAVPYLLDWQERYGHTITVELSDAQTGRLLHRSLYDAGRMSPIAATDRYEFESPQPDPSPDDPEFIRRKRDFLASRMGRFRRVTTAQGAPSDFCFERLDGKVRFDFMKPGACRKIARYIESLFRSDLDRMAGACMMMHQKTFAMHCGPLTSMHGDMTPESAIRLNAGHCYSRALSLAGVMREIRHAGTNRKYDATIMFVLGHVIVCVREKGRRYLFDPTWGSFLYRRDNRAFADEAELARDLSLVDRVVRDRHKDFFHPRSHAAARTGNVVWPAGAPVE